MKKGNENNKMVLLLTYRTSEEAEEVLSLLRAAGIPAFIESYYTNLILGSVVDVGGARLMVENKHAKEAVDLLKLYGLEVPRPENSTVAKFHRFSERSLLLRKVNKKYRLLVLLFLSSLLLFAILSLLYLIFYSGE